MRFVIFQRQVSPVIEGSGVAADIYDREGGSGTPNYVDHPESEGLFRKIATLVCHHDTPALFAYTVSHQSPVSVLHVKGKCLRNCKYTASPLTRHALPYK